jgi:hypothetical protein
MAKALSQVTTKLEENNTTKTVATAERCSSNDVMHEHAGFTFDDPTGTLPEDIVIAVAATGWAIKATDSRTVVQGNWDETEWNMEASNGEEFDLIFISKAGQTFSFESEFGDAVAASLEKAEQEAIMQSKKTKTTRSKSKDAVQVGPRFMLSIAQKGDFCRWCIIWLQLLTTFSW